MLNEMNLLVLDKAMDNFNGVMLYLEELSKTTNFILRYDFYITEVGIEVWTSMKENVAGAMWFADEYEDLIRWEEVPERYKRILGAK